MRILFLSQRVPDPPNKGDKIRSHHIMRRLAARHEVHLAFLLDEEGEIEDARRAEGWAASACWRVRRRGESLARGVVSAARGRPISTGWFRHADLSRDVKSLLRTREFDVVVAYCSSMAPYFDGFRGPRVVDLVDVDSEKWRQYASQTAFPRRDVYALEHRLLRAFERDLVRTFDRTLVVSRAERDLLATFADVSRVSVVGNGVDTDAFRRAAPRPHAPRLVFVGALDYFANADGVLRFVREVWPGVRRELPEAELEIVGRRPDHAVLALAREPGVRVVADPPDVRPHLWNAAVAVVPLWIARGTQNKVLEAMAAGVPVVATPASVQGIEAVTGRDFLQADSAAEWIRALLDLLRDPRAADEMAARAERVVVDGYSWDRQAALYEAEIVAAVQGRRLVDQAA